MKWSLDVGAAGLPAGPAISKDDSLLVPMTTGRILCVELSSGEIAEQTDPVLPALAWGHLTLANAEGDLLYSTPDRLIRLSSKRLKTQPGKPIEVAAALLDAKKWNEALSLANGILQQQPGNAEAKDICFQCRLSLAVNAPGLHLPQLKQMKKLPKQQIQVRALEVEVLIGQQKFQEAAFRLAEILTLETALLPLSYQGSIGQPGSEEIVIEKSFHSWATLELSALLERIPDPESIITQLEGATVSVLLSLHHPALLPTIHARCQSSNSYEESVQLLRHAVDIKSSGTAESSGGVSPTFRQEAELLRQLVKKLGEDASSPSLIALLNILALESPPEFLAAARSSDAFGATGLLSEETLRKQLYTQQQDEFGKWSVGPYHAIPVARLRSSGRVEKTLSLAEPDDLFLSRFQWSATAGEYGRLQIKNAVDRNVAQWSIPGNFQLHGMYSFQRDLLLRAGSVLLVKSYAGITAVSALDRRVLWSRTFPYVAGTRPSSVEQNFARLGTQKGYLPSQKLSSSFQVVGAGHGWLALTNGKTFSVVEIYSGRTKWSMTLPPNAAGVVASDTRVWVTFEDRSVASFSAEDGQGLSTPNVAEEPITPLRNVENQFVCWKQSADRHDPRLQWVDSSTNEIVDEVDLGQMQRFRFVDDSTLVGFNEQHQVQVVNLRSRVSKTLSFTPTVVEPHDSEEEGLPMWDPGRMQLALDGLNYYLCNRSKNNGELTRSPANRQLMVFDGDLIALDRQSGKQRWEFSNSNVLMSTVDQPELSVMVLVDASTPLAAGQTAGPSTFYGISKMAGRQLFEQSLPMQSSLRTLSIGSPAVDILDIGVQGLRVRIQAVPDQG